MPDETLTVKKAQAEIDLLYRQVMDSARMAIVPIFKALTASSKGKEE